MIWANINHCPKKLSASGHSNEHSHNSSHHNLESSFTSLASIPEENQIQSNGHLPMNGAITHAPSEISDHCKNLFEHENQYKSSLVVYADCHSASRGLFGTN